MRSKYRRRGHRYDCLQKQPNVYTLLCFQLLDLPRSSNTSVLRQSQPQDARAVERCIQIYKGGLVKWQERESLTSILPSLQKQQMGSTLLCVSVGWHLSLKKPEKPKSLCIWQALVEYRNNLVTIVLEYNYCIFLASSNIFVRLHITLTYKMLTSDFLRSRLFTLLISVKVSTETLGLFTTSCLWYFYFIALR